MLADGVSPAFFESLAKLRRSHGDFNSVATVFDDFEGKTYEGWTIVGDAFGKGPSHGTEPGQQSVSGFSGHGLVNTYVGGDGPQGTATSKPFRIQRRYIGFLIGGGNNPGKTCMNLRVDGKVVRTATGKNQEALEPASWDVADLKGREAVLEIVDRSSEGWGHINIDRIIFSDIAPEPLLSRGTTIESVVKALQVGFAKAEEATLPAGPIGHSRQHYHRQAHGPAWRRQLEEGRMDRYPLYASDRFPLRRAWLSGPGEHAGRRSAGDTRPAGKREHHSLLGRGVALEPGQRRCWPHFAVNR